MLKRFAAVLLLGAALSGGALLSATSARAQSFGDPLGLSPYWDWKTIETEHFRLHFPVELSDSAMKTANIYEEAHRLLVPIMKWEPHHKIQVVLIDNADSANGLTSAVGRFGMVLYLTPPDNWFSTTYYNDWLRLLVFHEYTHYLNMDVTTDFYALARYVFGDALLPNALFLPSWMLEGLAVYMETRLTAGGRGRGPYWEAILRSAVESGTLDTSEFVTLDKVNGRNPYFPGGETAYLFGYELMNEVSLSAGAADRAAGDEALGDLSYRSGGRFPYLINGNLNNVVDHDWYWHWDEFKRRTEERMRGQLAAIHSQPVTEPQLIEPGFTMLGSAVSPDGKWLAFTRDTSDRRMGLYLRNLESGETRRLDDKSMGAHLAFTPDSRRIVYSALHRTDLYYEYSDLATYDLEDGSSHWLTQRLRARDPDVSRDGKRVVFTVTETSRTGIGIASLNGGELADVRVLWMPPQLDHVASPRFTVDGKRVVFSLHRNGKNGEELLAIDVQPSDPSASQPQTLFADGHYNRFPAIGLQGEIYFVSDASGVDNLYRLAPEPTAKPEQLTNVTTALSFPTIGPKGEVYAAHLAHTGWNLSRVPVAAHPITTSQVVVSAPPAPPQLAASAEANAPSKVYAIEDYSPWPSLLPRQWAVPFVVADDGGLVLGGQVLGFDATDRHRYLALGGYNTLVKKPELLGIYQNRTLGPTLSASASLTTARVITYDNELYLYDRRAKWSLSAEQPFLYTYTTITPRLSVSAERRNVYFHDGKKLFDYGYVPEVDGIVAFSNEESSRLSVTSEEGRRTVLGSRFYIEPKERSWKGLLADRENIRLDDHVILQPEIKGSMTDHTGPYAASVVRLEGRYLRLFQAFDPSNLDQLAIRGYPGRAYDVKSAAVGSLDLRFPVARLFRGWGTNPFFAENVAGYLFAENTWIPGKEAGSATLPSAGTGIVFSFEILNRIPLLVSLDYHYGFRREVGGRGELFGQLALGLLEF